MAVYRLQALVGIRERAEESAKEAFAKAMNLLRKEQQEQERLEKELEDLIVARKRRREEYSQKLQSGEMKVTDQSAAARFIERMKERELEQQAKIDLQKENVRDAEKGLKRAQDDLVTATQDLKALEKHREKWMDEVKRERAMREEDNLDEIAQIIFNANKESK